MKRKKFDFSYVGLCGKSCEFSSCRSEVYIVHYQTSPGGGAHVKILTGMLVLFFWV